MSTAILALAPVVVEVGRKATEKRTVVGDRKGDWVEMEAAQVALAVTVVMLVVMAKMAAGTEVD